MKKILFSGVAALAAVTMSSQASAAQVITLIEEDGQLTGEFGDTIMTEGMFETNFTFNLPEDGFTSSTISQVAVSALTDIQFSEVLLNGTAFNLTGGGFVEFGSLEMLFTPSGQQTLTVRGNSGGNGSFAGTVAFIPQSAVPEPGTWALMLLGFAAVGFSLRRAKSQADTPRVRYNFA